MEAEKTKKILIILAVVAIAATILGTVLLINATTHTTYEYEEESRGAQAGTISLSIKEEPQEHTSSGSISLNIVQTE